MAFRLNDFDGGKKFITQAIERGALASLIVLSGPKKPRFSGPTPSNGPCNGIVRIKIMTSRAILTSGT
jgi:hypothetical protein